MNIKKLIATVVFALGAWMSVGVAQATNYNFTFTGEPDGDYSGVITGVFGVTGDSGSGYFITSISGNVSGFDYGNGAITGLIAPGGFENDNAFYPNGPNYLSTTPGSGNYPFGVSFRTADSSFNLAYWPNGLVNAEANSYEPFGTLTVSLAGSGAAPEMNASLIPQIALMLGCLFFLLGRKKENTESMLAA